MYLAQAKGFLPKAALIVTFFCLFALNGAVGRSETESPNGGMAREQLQLLLKPYLRLKSLRAEFVQKKHLADLNLDLVSTGRLQVDKPEKVLWTVLTPSFLEVAIEKKQLTLTSLKNGTKQIQKISFEQMGSNKDSQGLAILLPWLEMDVDALLKEYRVDSTSPSKIQFTPKNTSLFKTIQLSLGKNKHIETLLFQEKTGDSIAIGFKASRIENFN
jgi:hypothetical protein